MRKREGIVALTTVVIIALFLFSVGVLLAIQSRTSIISGQLEDQANQAQFLAEAGIQDAFIKIARDKDYVGTYTITETDPVLSVKKVDVTVATSSPTVSIVVATSTVARGSESVQRAIRATVTYDSNGKITNISKTSQ